MFRVVLLPGTTDVVVTTGKIVGFGSGVEAGDFSFGVTNSQLTRLKIADCPHAGINLFGDDNIIDRNITTGCGGGAGFGGIRVHHDRNVVRLNQVTRGGAAGIVVTGIGNDVLQNRSRLNVLDGLVVGGANNMADLNQFDDNSDLGIFDLGVGNIFGVNQCLRNGLGPSVPPNRC